MGEYIIYNARIWTADIDREWADALWVCNDKILAVGKYEDITQNASAHVKRIDMHNQFVMPSFVD